MHSESIAPETGGFTLIEVMVAMLVLAVGLLGLEALGIGAARSIALAERQSGYAVIASDSLESALHVLRNGAIPSQFCQENLSFGDRLSRTVDLSNAQLAQVTVRVFPAASQLTAPTDTFELSSSLYLPVALAGTVNGQPCS